MTGQVIQKGNSPYIKDGEDFVPMHNNSSWIAYINKIFEFKYVYVGKTKYAELIKQL